jgi:CheY-like chemotaxis protein
MAEISLVWVGDAQEVWPHALDRQVAGGVGVQHAESHRAAERILADPAQAVDLLVLSESRPGRFSAAAIEALRRRSPLARVWRLLGSWCEGETRSGRPPLGCLSTYWHQWEARWAQERARAAAGHPPAWALPLTSSPEERALAAAEYPLARAGGPIGICAPHAATAMALADACRLGGYSPEILRLESRLEAGCWRPEAGEKNAQGERQPPISNPKSKIKNPKSPTPDPSPILWDTSADEMTNPAALERLRALAGQGPILAVVGFPRPDDIRRAAEAGIAAVVSKPYSVHDLLWQLARVVDGRAD